jgi:hypothetical protein
MFFPNCPYTVGGSVQNFTTRCKVEEIEYFEIVACVKRLASVAMVLGGDAEKIGMRPEAAGLIQEQLGAMKRVYALLQERTGIAAPEIEELMTNRSG